MTKKLPKRTFSLTEKKIWMKNIFKIYGDMRKKSKKGNYEIKVGNISLIVYPKVYAPQFFSDSLWFSAELPKIIGKKSLLEIGTGTGIIGILCALKGAKVVLTDINPNAVKNAIDNVYKHNLNISVREGNLYEPIRKDEKFDYIFWAHPYNNSNKPVKDMLLRSGFDYNYEGLKGYIRNAKFYLAPNGKLLLGTGDSADINTIIKVANKEGYSIKVRKRCEMPLGTDKKSKITNMIIQFNPYPKKFLLYNKNIKHLSI